MRIAEACQSRADKFLSELLHGSSGARVFALRLDPRSDKEEALCFMIEGRGTISFGDAVHSIEAGEVAVAPAGAIRGLAAETRCLALWIQVSAKDGADE